MKPSHPALTAEAALRIDALYTASASLTERAEIHLEKYRTQRARFCYRAAGRLQSQAWRLLFTSLSACEMTRLVKIRADNSAAARKAA